RYQSMTASVVRLVMVAVIASAWSAARKEAALVPAPPSKARGAASEAAGTAPLDLPEPLQRLRPLLDTGKRERRP
ncbi:hypothetical protein ACIBI3_22030, partial [Actinomadura luteofluorescens]